MQVSGRLVWIALGSLALPACCSPACRDEFLPEFKDRATPIRTVELLRYAVINDCDRIVYECMNKRSQDLVDYWRFRFGYCALEFPGTDISVCELIPDLDDLDMEVSGTKATVRGFARGTYRMQLILHEEEGQWKIDAPDTAPFYGYEIPIDEEPDEEPEQKDEEDD